MRLDVAFVLARSLMQLHGLEDWTFKFDRAKRRYGLCRRRKKLISLSKPLTLLATEKQVTNTILHEIAHALTPNDKGHGKIWREKAIAIGCNGERCGSGEPVPYSYLYSCPFCKREWKRYRRYKRIVICPMCKLDLLCNGERVKIRDLLGF